MHPSYVVALWLFTVTIFGASALDNGLARTPPMGWLTWERFRCNIDCTNFPADCIGERLIRETADRMASDGWLAAGYKYVTVDDCWAEKQRDSRGNLVADKTRFPNGMKAVADYVHSKGLLFGIYADFGTLTCGGYPGSEFFLEKDANTFASWGVDLVKLDGCYSSTDQQPEGYAVFGLYLNQTGRPMLYSCSWPAYKDFSKEQIDSSLLIKTCNMWRLYDDIQDSWDSVITIIQFYKNNLQKFASWAGPGHWNDPDMVILGDFGLSVDQQRVQMAMWAIFAAPLILSSDLRAMPNISREILLNPRLIRINQDSAGTQGLLLTESGGIQAWKRPLSTGEQVLAFLNTRTDGTPIRVVYAMKDLGFDKVGKTYTIFEAFKGTLVGTFVYTNSLVVIVNPTGVVMLTVQ